MAPQLIASRRSRRRDMEGSSRTERLTELQGATVGRTLFTEGALPAVLPAPTVADEQTVASRVDNGSILTRQRHEVLDFEADDTDRHADGDDDAGRHSLDSLYGQGQPVTKQEERLKTARTRIAATLQETQRKVTEVDEEKAAKLLTALWRLLDEFGATDNTLRGVMCVPTMALDVTEAVTRHDHSIIDIVDGPWS